MSVLVNVHIKINHGTRDMMFVCRLEPKYHITRAIQSCERCMQDVCLNQ